jgi:hypothetical protein
MLMYRDKHVGEQREEVSVMVSQGLYVDQFLPLSERLPAGQQELRIGLNKLASMIGEAEFDQYIETLVSLRRQGDSLFVVTDREFHRSLLVRNFLTQMKQAFGVEHLQVVSQAQ